MTRIVGVLCTYNEEANIRASLGSLLAWCDEVVVVDQHSTDLTRDIAAGMGARVELHEKVGVPEPARDWARSNVETDWVVFLDADEIIPATLAAYLRRVLEGDVPWDILAVPRVNIELGRWLRQSGNWPSRKLRIARPDALEIGTRLHRGMEPRPGRRVGMIPAESHLAIWHFHHQDVETTVTKWNRYTTIEAQQMAATRKRPPGLRRMFEMPATWLWRSYIRGRGYRDGRAGLVVAVNRTYYRFLMVVKQWDLADAQARADRLAAVKVRLIADHERRDEAERRASLYPDPTTTTLRPSRARQKRRQEPGSMTASDAMPPVRHQGRP